MTNTTPLLITPETKVGVMLDRYPESIDTLVSPSGRYRNLTNPMLCKAVALRTPLKLVAQMGGMDLTLLVDTLRRAVGQPPLDLPKQNLYALVYLERNLEKGDSIATRSG